MSQVTLISVVIPVYNAQAYLTQCLESVLTNTWRSLEILCVNDGSTDQSKQIILDYAKKDERVILIDQPNGGVSAARNAGLAQAHGDCVAFVDADDFVAPDYFASLADALEESGADIAVCDAFRGPDAFLEEAQHAYVPDTAAEYSACGDRVLSDSFLLNYIWGRLYTVSCLEGARFPASLSLGEDTAFNIQLYAHSSLPTVVYSPKKMYFYRTGHASSLVNSYDKSMVIRRAEWCLAQYDQLNERAKTIYLDVAVKSFWAYRYLTRYSGGDRQKIKTIRRQCRKYAKQLPLSPKTRLKYFLFTNFPQSYRLFRLLTDRTLIQWEKEQKKAAKAERKSHE
ncbi:MAG: glycosyltransferase [Clostridia bacterium]|nr:glycosyltransferase [Clostridia bacterium]